MYKLEEHENSQDHKKNYLDWKLLEKRLKHGGTVDDSLLNAIKLEMQNWREILKIIVDVILFCATNNLPLRGTTEIIGNTQPGLLLNLIELISHYNPLIKKHIELHKKGFVSYLSPTIQNEFIILLGNKVRSEIIKRVKSSKYFSLLFDCTPDISHLEQMSQVIRYVCVFEGQVKIEESFIDFIISHQKTGFGLSSEILNKIEKDGLDIKNARGQSYDNGANMAGKYKGVQVRILEKNNLAKFIPCSAHSLNLASFHAAQTSAEMKTFFGTIQSLYVFFSSSTARWEILKNCVNRTLKRYSDTRWASRHLAVKSLYDQLPDIKRALQNISKVIPDPETISSSNNFLKQIDFKFICSLCVWNKILHHVQKINLALQTASLNINQAVELIEGLKNSIQEIRNTVNEILDKDAFELANKIDILPEMPIKRRKQAKRLDLDESRDESRHFSAKQAYIMEIYEVLDTLINHLNWRFDALNAINEEFSFLNGTSIEKMNISELRKCAMDLARKYNTDINGQEFCDEIESFKNIYLSISKNISVASPLDILQLLYDYSLVESYPNLCIAYRIFLTLPVTTATNERSYSKLKLIKTYLRATTGQGRLSDLYILAIEKELANKINFEDIINEFAFLKARKVKM